MAAGIINKLKHEWEVLKGETGKDKTFCSEQEYPTESEAQAAFSQGKERLFNINAWSDLPGINSTFCLYNQQGEPTTQQPITGFHIKIVLPGVPVENWVEVAAVQETDAVAQFTVHPCPNPQNAAPETQHFFAKAASSTFRVEQNGAVLRGYQIGKNEVINNQDQQAGDRAVLNTLIAAGGWAGFQDIQWLKLTDYLAGKKELAS